MRSAIAGTTYEVGVLSEIRSRPRDNIRDDAGILE